MTIVSELGPKPDDQKLLEKDYHYELTEPSEDLGNL